MNVVVLGNLHWSALMALERGTYGGDVQQAKARAVYVAGEAGKRHSDLPTDFVLPESVPSRWTWLPLTARLAAAFGWAKFYQEPAAAEAELMPCSAEENAQAGRKPNRKYVGPVGGYHVDLRDGVTVRLRFSKDGSGQLHTEYRISARWALPSPMQKLLDAADHVFKYFETRQHEEVRAGSVGATLNNNRRCGLMLEAGTLC